MQLAPGEKIEEISGSVNDDHLIYIKFVTNKMQTLEAGGVGGSPFRNLLKEAITIKAFGGSLSINSSSLSSLYFYYSEKDLNKVLKSEREIFTKTVQKNIEVNFTF